MQTLNLLTSIIGMAMAAWMAYDYRRYRGWRRLAWLLAAIFLAVGALASLRGGTGLINRVGFLTGSILGPAFLGLGGAFLLARRRTAQVLFVIVTAASLGMAALVLAAPPAAGEAAESVRALALGVNLLAIVLLVGGGLINLVRFAWFGGSPARAITLGLSGLGLACLNFGAGLLPFAQLEAAFFARLVGLVLVFTGLWMAKPGSAPAPLTEQQLIARKHKASTIAIFAGLAALMGAVAALPVIPWLMGIVTNVKSSYTATLPTENRGSYLMTDQGVMELYPWYVEPDDFPTDAPVLAASSVHTIGIIQKQFDVPENYQLISLSNGAQIPWRSFDQSNGELILNPGTLDPGQYELVVPEDSMFGGSTEQFFVLK